MDHKGLFCGVDVQTARSHFALSDDEQKVKYTSIKTFDLCSIT